MSISSCLRRNFSTIIKKSSDYIFKKSDCFLHFPYYFTSFCAGETSRINLLRFIVRVSSLHSCFWTFFAVSPLGGDDRYFAFSYLKFNRFLLDFWWLFSGGRLFFCDRFAASCPATVFLSFKSSYHFYCHKFYSIDEKDCTSYQRKMSCGVNRRFSVIFLLPGTYWWIYSHVLS